MGYQTAEKTFFEVRMTKDGIQYMAVRDIEVSGLTTSKSKAVVERIVERMFAASREPPPEVSMVASFMTDYIASIMWLKTEYVSIGTSIKIGDVRITLHIYLYYYRDEEKNVEEWRGQVEALAEGRDSKRSKGQHLAKKRIVFGKELSSFAVYRALMQTARHAYSALQE